MIPRLAITFLLALSAFSADLQVGLRAYDAHDYATAFRELLPLAEQGNVHAQACVGWMYAEGKGVESNPEEAKRWFSLAAKQGGEYGEYAKRALKEELAKTNQSASYPRDDFRANLSAICATLCCTSPVTTLTARKPRQWLCGVR